MIVPDLAVIYQMLKSNRQAVYDEWELLNTEGVELSKMEIYDWRTCLLDVLLRDEGATCKERENGDIGFVVPVIHSCVSQYSDGHDID